MEVAHKRFLSDLSSGGQVWVQGVVVDRNVGNKTFPLDDGSAVATISCAGNVMIPEVGSYVLVIGSYQGGLGILGLGNSSAASTFTPTVSRTSIAAHQVIDLTHEHLRAPLWWLEVIDDMKFRAAKAGTPA